MRRFQINHAKVSTSRPRGRGTRPPAGAPAAGLPEPRSAADLPATAAARRVQHPKATPEPAERSDSDVLLTATLPGAPRTARAPTTGATSPSHVDFVVFFFPVSAVSHQPIRNAAGAPRAVSPPQIPHGGRGSWSAGARATPSSP